MCAPGGESYTQIIECQADEACFEGTCCAPDCEGKVCGDDGCGGAAVPAHPESHAARGPASVPRTVKARPAAAMAAAGIAVSAGAGEPLYGGGLRLCPGL